MERMSLIPLATSYVFSSSKISNPSQSYIFHRLWIPLSQIWEGAWKTNTPPNSLNITNPRAPTKQGKRQLASHSIIQLHACMCRELLLILEQSKYEYSQLSIHAAAATYNVSHASEIKYCHLMLMQGKAPIVNYLVHQSEFRQTYKRERNRQKSVCIIYILHNLHICSYNRVHDMYIIYIVQDNPEHIFTSTLTVLCKP